MEDKVEFKSLKDRIKMFGGQKNSVNKNTNKDNSNTTNSNKNNTNNIPSNKNSKETNSNNTISKNNSTNNKNSQNTQNIPKNEKTKIIGNDLLEEKGNIKIYKYPKKESTFPTKISIKAKKILFLGNTQESFINTFINIYRNIEMKDEFRHKIDINNIKAIKSSYDISSFDNSDYIRITSIPFCEVKNENYMKKIIMEISKMKVHLVFYTFDKNISNIDLEQEKEIEFYKYLIHFLELRDKLIFLCDSKEDLKNEEINQFINKFNIDENDDIYTGGKIYSNSNKIFFINNEIIYDTNNNLGIQKEWEIINNKMKEIKEIIKSQEMKEIQKNEFFNFLLSDNKNKVEDYFNKLRTHENKDKYYFLYFFGEIKFDKDRSDILINLINKMITMINVRHKWIKKDSNEIEFIDNKNYRYIIRPISKINFSNLKNIVFKNCELYDDNSILLNNLITTNLERLDLSFNKLNK